MVVGIYLLQRPSTYLNIFKLMNSIINLETQYSPLINEFVHAVRKYYSIDPKIPNREYDGYNLLVEIIENKIDQLVDNMLPKQFYNLIEAINLDFKEYTVFDKCYEQFPNYSLTIELANRISNNIQCISLLNLRMSLLTNYYTIFFEEVNIFNDFSENERINRPLSFRIFSSRNNGIDPEKILLKKLKKMIDESFPEYKFVHHKILFDLKIDSAEPIGLTGYGLNSYPIYAFLFDNNYHLPTYQVIE